MSAASKVELFGIPNEYAILHMKKYAPTESNRFSDKSDDNRVIPIEVFKKDPNFIGGICATCAKCA